MHKRWILVLPVLILTAAVGFAAESGENGIREEATLSPAIPGQNTQELSPVVLEIRARMQEHQDVATAHAAEMRTASGDRYLELARLIEDSAEAMMLDILGIKIKHARKAGQEELVKQYEAQVEHRIAMKANPRGLQDATTPVNRPLPSTGGSR